MEEINEVMINEEEFGELSVMDDDYEVGPVNDGTGWKVALGVGVGTVIGAVGTWLTSKILKKRAAKKAIAESEVIDAEFEEVEETDEEKSS